MLKEPFLLEIDSHRKILNTIRVKKEISGAELSRMTKYQPSTIVYILRALEQKKLIEVSRIDNSLRSAGKPPTLWRLVADIGYIIGVEIIPNELRATVIDFSGKVLYQEHKTGLVDMVGDKVAVHTHDFVQELIEQKKIDRDKIIGLGVALPGLVDRQNGMVLYSRNMILKNFPLQKRLRDDLGVPVEIVNDANAGALGLRWNLDAPEMHPPNFVFLTLNEKNGEMGAGLILNDRLYEGAVGSAGEIFISHPPLAELVVKGRKKYGEAQSIVCDLESDSELSLALVIEHAKNGCDISNYILHTFGLFIIDEIFRIIEFLNPNQIIIGGDITDAESLIRDYIINRVEKKLLKFYPVGIPLPDIKFSSVGIYSVSIGATALILRKIFL